MISLRVWNWLADLAQRERRIQYTNAAVPARINEHVERTARSTVRSDETEATLRTQDLPRHN